MPDPVTLHTGIKDLKYLLNSKPLPFSDLRLPISKGHIELPKLRNTKLPISKGHITLPMFHAYPYNREYKEDGDYRYGDGIAFGPPIIPPITNYQGSIDHVNPFKVKRHKFPYNPPTSSTTTPAVGYTNFDPLNYLDPATTTRSAPPTRDNYSEEKEFKQHFTPNVDLGITPGP